MKSEPNTGHEFVKFSTRSKKAIISSVHVARAAKVSLKPNEFSSCVIPISLQIEADKCDDIVIFWKMMAAEPVSKLTTVSSKPIPSPVFTSLRLPLQESV